MVTTAMLLVWMAALSPSSALSSFFSKVLVSKATMMASNTLEVSPLCPSLSPSLCCSSICNTRDWCQAWCQDPAANQCLLSDLIVMPTYAEPNPADGLTCYTERLKDLATGAAIDAGTQYSTVPLRAKENMVDGIYILYNADHWFFLDLQDYPWLVLDFGEPVPIRRVKIWSQSHGAEQNMASLNNLEVRTGMAAAATRGDFSSYDLFGTFVGPASEFNQEVVFEVPTPVTARFLSLQRDEPNAKLQIAHMEVY